MVLEAVMICVDNSEWMRNGDYPPSRMVSQNETVNFIANAKIQGNPETTVGLLTMAGRRVEVLATPSRKLNIIMTALSQVQPAHECKFMAALKTAQLALKNRPNKNQRQRIIAFSGSPIMDEKKKLIKLGKQFKKNNISVDVVNFGTENTTNSNTEKLEAFINAVNSSDNSHLVSIPPGPHVMANLVLTSPILVQGASGVTIPSAGSSALPRVGGSTVEEDNDRDFQLALRLSLEASREAQEKAATETKAAETKTEAKTETKAPEATNAPMDTGNGDGSSDEESDEEEDDEDDFDEEEFARAIAMSMAGAAQPTGEKKEEAKKPAEEAAEDDDAMDADELAALEDPDFIRSLLEGDENVDEGDVDDILKQLQDE